MKQKKQGWFYSRENRFFCYLSFCTLCVHVFCTYVRVWTQPQNLRFFVCLQKIAKIAKLVAKFAKIDTCDFSQFFVVLMSVSQVEPSCGFFQICENRKVANFHVTGDFSQSLVVGACAMSSENQPRVTSLTVSFRSVHSTTALNCWAWGTCARFFISHFENYQTVNRGYPFFSFLFCFTKEQAHDSTLVLLTPKRSNRSLSVL